MKLLIFVLALSALVVAMAPAALIDRTAGELSRGDLRVGETSGSIWNGRGVVHVIDVPTRAWQPWFQVEWSFDPFGLFHGELAWRIIINSVNVSELAVGLPGWHVRDFEISGPARYLWQRVPGPLAKFGWDGDVILTVGNLECSWHGSCSGHSSARWTEAGSDFLPGQVFGDYQIQVKGVAGEFTLDWTSSSESAVRTSGTGRVSRAGILNLTGIVNGDPVLLGRLPAVAGPWVRPTGAADTWKVVFP